jgi:hypothetical protein
VPKEGLWFSLGITAFIQFLEDAPNLPLLVLLQFQFLLRWPVKQFVRIEGVLTKFDWTAVALLATNIKTNTIIPNALDLNGQDEYPHR